MSATTVPVPVPAAPAKLDALGETCLELQRLQRRRASFIKSRIVAENNRLATVATLLGYHSGLEPEERTSFFDAARDLVKKVTEAHAAEDLKNDALKHVAAGYILAAQGGITSLETLQASLEKNDMLPLAKTLPVAQWIAHEDQRGVSLTYLAVIVGEAGDLRVYSNPGKLWRRFGCAPWTYRGATLMGSTWKAGVEGKLPADQWELFGYSPRRRSIAFMIGQNLKMANKSIYRARYESAKEAYATNHPDKVACVCAGTGKNSKNKPCAGCLGKGRKMLRADRHGMLLATKLFLKRLWKCWCPAIDRGEYLERFTIGETGNATESRRGSG